MSKGGTGSRQRHPHAFVLPAMACLGAFAAITQVMALRELLVIFHGNELTIGAILGSWLVSVGLGAVLARAVVDRLPGPVTARGIATTVFIALTLTPSLMLLALRRVPAWLHLPAGELAPFGAVLGTACATMLPVGLCIGFVFPLVCKALYESPGVNADAAVTRVYTAEALGSMIGGAGLTFLLLPHLSPFSIALLAGGLVLAGAAGLLAGRWGRRLTGIAALGIIALALVYPPCLQRLEAQSVQVRWQALGVLPVPAETDPDNRVVTTWCGGRDTVYQNLALTQSGRQYTLYGNGQVLFAFPDPIAREHAVHFLMAQRPEARRVLLLGGDAAGDIPELLKYPLEAVVQVELDPGIGQMVESVRPRSMARLRRDPRVRFIHDDGIRFLQRCTNTFDVVWLQAPQPVTTAATRYYTRECFAHIHRLLTDDGLMATRVSTSVHLRSEAVDLAASIYRTLQAVFPEVRATAEAETRFLAGKRLGGVTLDAETLVARSRAAGLQHDYFRPEYFLATDALSPARIQAMETRLASAATPLNTTLRPVSTYHSLMLWTRHTGSRVAGWLGAARRLSPVAVCGMILVMGATVAILGRRTPGRHTRRWSRGVTAGVLAGTGFCGMALELVLIFALQGLFGYVYHRIGLIVAAFMLGLLVGAPTGRRLAANGGPVVRRRLIGVELVLLVVALTVPWLVHTLAQSGGGDILIYVMVTAVGGAVGAEFPLGNRVFRDAGGRVGATAAVTDASDHLGAAVGALTVGVILVPVMGITATCLLVACLKLAGVMALATLPKPPESPPHTSHRPRT